MRVTLLAVAARPPAWAQAGLDEYARRLPADWRFTVQDLPLATRRATPSPAEAARARTDEGLRVLKALPAGAHVVALDEAGEPWSSVRLSQRLGAWKQAGRHVVLLVGGPDGHDDAVRARAAETWSLSALTFPHAMVKVVLAEQLYRAETLLLGHPYHRA